MPLSSVNEVQKIDIGHLWAIILPYVTWTDKNMISTFFKAPFTLANYPQESKNENRTIWYSTGKMFAFVRLNNKSDELS